MKRLTLTIAMAMASTIGLNVCNGQAGVSSMSSSALHSGVRLNHEEIRVEELVNFHRHRLPLPSVDERISLDVQSGFMADGKFAFQIGLATHRDIVDEFRMPLNLVLVIDRSGSMSGDRIAKVKDALVRLVEKLGNNDFVSIVTYNDTAEVCLEATKVRNNDSVNFAIQGIEASGSTNLHAGLMKGYELAHQCFDSRKANRVILLTDGIANHGVTDETTIAKESKSFNDLGIGLSTIGLGGSFNRSLLRELADAGNGAIHFIADAGDIQKVFVDEFDSLLSPSASNVKVTVKVPAGEKLPKIFGYQAEKVGSCFRIPLENMSYGATQVIVGRFGSRLPSRFEVTLNYTDSMTGKEFSTVVASKLDVESRPSKSLKKNYAIAKVSNAIKKSAKLSESRKYGKARTKLSDSIEFARGLFELESDRDVDRVCEIALRQKNALDAVCKLETSSR